MYGLTHMIVISFGILGLVLGGVLIDVDHKSHMTAKEMWKEIWKVNYFEYKGILHNPVILMSIILFSICLGIGLLSHLVLDYVRFI